MLLRFFVGALIGVIAAVAVGAVVAKPKPFGPTAAEGLPISLVDEDGSPLDFSTLKVGDPAPIDPLPNDATIQLAAFHGTGASPDPGGGQQPWWNNTVPRIPPISQFDGGPLARVNCLMAAAAMLARLGWGVVATGSQMRALSGDTDGGTTYQNAQTAVKRGWDVRFFEGAITPLQLRAVLWAGAGAIIHGVYGKLPVGVRLQASFTGRHAVYVDAFSPTGYKGGPGYYVMDPIGKTWNGYKGGWWPAADVERFAVELSGGRLGAMWAFPGGKAPANRPILPPEGYPSNDPGGTPRPEPSGPTGSLAPEDPFPVDPLPLPPGQPPLGEETGVEPPYAQGVEIVDENVVVWPGFGGKCLDPTSKLGCPAGIVGIIDLGGLGAPPTKPPIRGIDILYGTMVGPGMYQIIYEPPPETTRAELLFWETRSGSRLQSATVEEGTLDGRTVAIGTIVVDPTLDYQFVATAEGDGIRTLSTVGEVKQ